MDEWFAQNPLMGALGRVIALGILIYMLAIMMRNVGEYLPRKSNGREVDSSLRVPPP
jgi:hypothetical protein